MEFGENARNNGEKKVQYSTFPSEETALFSSFFLLLDFFCQNCALLYKSFTHQLLDFFETEQICQSVIKSFLFLNFRLIDVHGINMKAFKKNTCDGPHSCTFWWCDLSEEWWQGDRWTSPRSHGYVPGKVGLLCPREGRGICCIANWWSLVNCRVGRKLELTNQTGLFQRSWQLQYTANLTVANITDGIISLRTNSPFSWQWSENTLTSLLQGYKWLLLLNFFTFISINTCRYWSLVLVMSKGRCFIFAE